MRSKNQHSIAKRSGDLANQLNAAARQQHAQGLPLFLIFLK